MKRAIAAILSALCLLCCLWRLWDRGDGGREPAPAESAVLPTGGQQEQTEDSGEAEAVYMALTFDDGPGRYTESLLDGLQERGVHATFFLIGKQIGEHEELVRRMAREGHQIGNHSYDHADLSTLSCAAVLEDIAQCDAVLQTLLGEDTYWVRPPYGLICTEALGQLSTPLITWSVDTEDWKSKDESAILDHIYRDSFDGCIILLHDQYRTTLSATMKAIDHLRQQGVEFVTLEELFRLRGVAAEPGKVYRKVPGA